MIMADQLALVQTPRAAGDIQRLVTIGSGSFGTVHKAEVQGQICAVKYLHQQHLQQLIQNRTLERFRQECLLLNSLKHSNIVQCLGTRFVDQPILIMELMDCNLGEFLRYPRRNYIGVNIVANIVDAISYLHRCGIVHRDLSSANVLMKNNIAKVTDFGMARIADESAMSPLTRCPGAIAYMPPEALNRPPDYNFKIDIFSVGVLVIQILTGQVPNPTERILLYPDSIACTVVSEMERRKQHIDECDDHNPLKTLALLCLRDKQDDRPTAEQLADQLICIQKSQGYKDDRCIGEAGMQLAMQYDIPQVFQTFNNQLQAIQDLTLHVNDLRKSGEQQIMQLKSSLQQSEKHLGSRMDDLVAQNKHEMQKELQQYKRDHNQVVEQEVDEYVQKMQSESEGEKKLVQAQNEQLQAQNEQLQAEKCQSDAKILELEESLSSLSLSSSLHLHDTRNESRLSQRLPSIVFESGISAPKPMHRWSSAVTHDNAVYVTPGRTKVIYKYTYSDNLWTEYAECQAEKSTLVFVNNSLVTVGGQVYSKGITSNVNLLYSLCSGNWNDNDLPPMRERRDSVIAVTSGKALIVAGGCRAKKLSLKVEELNVVEIYHLESKQWQYVSNLPFPLYHASVTTCGDRVFIFASSPHLKSVLTCQLTNLVMSCGSSYSEWSEISEVPLSNSTCATFKGHLLAVGGLKPDHSPSNEVFCYDEDTDSWSNIGQLDTAREQCFAAILSSNLFVIGGKNKSLLSSVEIGTFE